MRRRSKRLQWRVMASERDTLPQTADACCKLGDALFDLGNLDEAIVCYRHAIELQPDFIPAHYNLGTALKDQGKLDHAAAYFRRALGLKPDFVEAQFNLGYVLQKQGQLDEAVHCF